MQVKLSDNQLYEFPDDATPQEVQKFDLSQQLERERSRPEMSWFDKKIMPEGGTVRASSPFVGAEQAAIAIPGTIAKTVATAAEMMPAYHEPGEIISPEERELERRWQQRNTAQHIQAIKESPLFKFGEDQEARAQRIAPLNRAERDEFLVKSAQGAVSMAPIIASGPFAPATIGLQSFSEHLIQDYDEAKSRGISDDEAAASAMRKAVISGGIQGAVFALLPAPLRKLGDKYLVDRFGTGAVSDFITKRAAQTGEMGALMGVSHAGEQAVEGRNPLEGLPSAAAGGALLGALTPRGGPPRGFGEPPVTPTEPITPPEPGPIGRIPDIRVGPRRRITLGSPTTGDQNAIQERIPTPLPVAQAPESSPEVVRQIRQPEEPAIPQAQEEAPRPNVTPEVAETPPEETPHITQIAGVEPRPVPVTQIAARPELMQFKHIEDGATGENESEKLTGKWDPYKAGPLLLWEPTDPSKYGLTGDQKYIVANGHHRFAFGQREGVDAFSAQVLREADGFSAEDARRKAAEVNIADGKGTIYDQVKYLRNERTTRSPDEEMGDRTRIGARGGKATAIAFDASDSVYTAFINEKISPDQAESIALAAPKDQLFQDIGLKQALKGRKPQEISNDIQASMVNTAYIKTDQLSLWGNDDRNIKQAELLSDFVSGKQKELNKRIQAISGASKNPEIARSEGIDVKDPDAVRNRLIELNQKELRLSQWSSSPGLIAELKAEFEAKQKGETKPALTLAPPESVEEQKARLAKEEEARKAQSSKEAVAVKAAAPLTGTTGDLGQADLLGGPTDLFAPKPKPGILSALESKLSPTELSELQSLKSQLIKKLPLTGGQMGTTLDPTTILDGARIAAIYAKAGLRAFRDFANQVLADFGEAARPYLAAWYGNLRIQLGKDSAGMDSEKDVENIYEREFATSPAGTAVGGRTVPETTGGQGAKRSPVARVARRELIPEPKSYVGVDSYAAKSGFTLSAEQVLGINQSVTHFFDRKGPASVLADGAGFGKSAQLLGVADQFLKRDPNARILIVTQNAQMIGGTLSKDGAAMGLPMKKISWATYDWLKNGTIPKTVKKNIPHAADLGIVGGSDVASGQFDLVIFDEAHNLKNDEALKSLAAARVKATHKLFSTATPMDRPTGASYFLSEITGEDQLQVAAKLGFTYKQIEDPITRELRQAAVLLPNTSWPKVWANIIAYRDTAIRGGAYLRREYPFFGDINIRSMGLSRDANVEQTELLKWYDNMIDSMSSMNAKRNYSGQKTLAARRWAEAEKVNEAYAMAKEHLAKGGQVIIMAETDKAQSFPIIVRGGKMSINPETGREVWKIPGAITKLTQLFERDGINVAHIHDTTENVVANEVDKFQGGEAPVALATPKSGGAGINLDDVVGNKPRLLIVLSKNLAGDVWDQVLGRVSRKTTQSEARVEVLHIPSSYGDQRSDDILNTKVRTLRAIQGGEDLDVATFGESGRLTPEQQATIQSAQGQTFRQKAEGIASKLEEYKAPGPETGALQVFGLTGVLWNQAVSIVQAALRAGGSLADAIEKGVKFIKDNFKGEWDEKGAREALSSPETAGKKSKQVPTQVAGEDVGPLRNVEHIAPIRAQIKERLFNGEGEINPSNTEKAVMLIRSASDPATRLETTKLIKRDIQGDMTMGLLQSELWTYANRLVIKGDDTLMREMVRNHGTFSHTIGGEGPTAAGRMLRSLLELSKHPSWRNAVSIAKELEEAAGRKLGVGVEALNKIIDAMKRVVPEESDFEKKPDPKLPAEPTGATESKALEEEYAKDESRNEAVAFSIMDTMEKAAPHGAEWLKPDVDPNIVRVIVQNYLRPTAGNQKAFVERTFVSDMAKELRGVGVASGTAARLAKVVYDTAVSNWADARKRATIRASTSRSLSSLMEAIRTTPLLTQQRSQSWRVEAATNWFMSHGLSRDQAEAAAKEFIPQFENALGNAAIRVAKPLLERAGAGPKSMAEFIQIVRAGMLDPNFNLAEEYAKRAGWKPPTQEQLSRIAALEMKLDDPNLSLPERSAIAEQMMGEYRHMRLPPSMLRTVAANFVVTNLMGIATQTVHAFGPAVFMLTDRVLGSMRHPSDLMTMWSNIGEQMRSFINQQKFVLKHDAAFSVEHELQGAHNELKRVWEVAQRDIKSGSPPKAALGYVKAMFGSQQFVMRLLGSWFHSNWMAVRESQLTLYGKMAFKDAGLGEVEINALTEATSSLKNQAYQEAIDSGLDENTAHVRADAIAADQLVQFIENKTSPSAAAEVQRSAELDAWSTIGRRDPKTEEEGGLISSVLMNPLMKAAGKLRSGPSLEPAIGVFMFGYMSVPFRTARYYAWNSPYGLLRIGIHNLQKSRGWKPWYEQSLATELQYRNRLHKAIAASVMQTLLLAAFGSVVQKTSDPDAAKKGGIFFMGTGPKNKETRDALAKMKFQENAINIFLPGHTGPIHIPLTRVGEPLAYLFWPLVAADDRSWRKREAEITGKPFNESVPMTAIRSIGALASLLSQHGPLQQLSHITRAGGGPGVTRALVTEGSSVLASATQPFLGLQRNISNLMIGPVDQSSLESAAAAAFPMLGIFGDKFRRGQINRFGDRIYDQTWEGKIQKMGFPMTFAVSNTTENKELYTLLAEKGVAPAPLLRSHVEATYRPMSDAEWQQYGIKDGAALKKTVLDNLDSLKDMDPESVKKFLNRAASSSDSQTAMELGLERSKPGRAVAAGGEGRAPSDQAIKGPQAAGLGRARGVKARRVSFGGRGLKPRAVTAQRAISGRLGGRRAPTRRVRLSAPRARHLRLPRRRVSLYA